jgi:plastocyanin
MLTPFRMRACAAAAMMLAAAGCGSAEAGAPSEPTAPAVQDVYTLPASFTPVAVTIRVGGTVRFNFGGGIPHNVIFAPASGRPADIDITPSGIVSRTFATRGRFPYECTLHDGMIGEVNVQ